MIEVVAGIIAQSTQHKYGTHERYLVGQRHPDAAYPNLWEFPGGKVDVGETQRQALGRKLREELDLQPAGFGVTPEFVSEAAPGYEVSFYTTLLIPSDVRRIKLNVHQDILWLPISVLRNMFNLTPSTAQCVRFLSKQS